MVLGNKLFNFYESFQNKPASICSFCLSKHRNCSSIVKKNVSGPYPLKYHPNVVEQDWYVWWEKNGFFHPDSHASAKENKQEFLLVLPPPNVTGNLHIGHSLTVTIQDCISRWRRMRGDSVVWIPGYDHGGIATQMVVEKKLWKEKKLTRHDMGRTQFIAELNNWKDTSKGNIESQLKRLGSSLDFRKTCFTMDENSSNAVSKVFVKLFDENLIYRKEKLVNWSCELRSVISDIEVDHVEVPGETKFYLPGLKNPVKLGVMDYFYYPLENSNEKVPIATTRLETMLGDTAIAVNPLDNRHSHLIGKFAVHPYTNERLPIIADESINKEFGTGAMKVTPAHDAKDYELGLKHNLELKDIFSDDGTITADFENFKGKHRLLVRELIRNNLSTRGLFIETRSNPMRVPICSRSGDLVESRLKEQWFLDCTEMGKKAVQVVKDGKLQFIPSYHEKLWNEWFRHLKDWCISRQLWWGHQIPAYHIQHRSEPKEAGLWIAAESKEQALQKAGNKLNVDSELLTATQDNDVLDTWFSSALYPLTSQGWPLKAAKQLSLMETGSDILFFWVARMVMLGQHITGELPFQKVLLHGMVCDSHGRKMSKSLGNTIDPLDVIEGRSLQDLLRRVESSKESLTPIEFKSAISGYKKNFPNGIPECGTDGLRFSLLTHDVQGARINVDVQSIRVCHNFCNKIWQGFRLYMKTAETCPLENLTPLTSNEVLSISELSTNRWILSKLSVLVTACNTNFEDYNFHMVTGSIKNFWVQNYCDVYLEFMKSTLVIDPSQNVLLSRVMLTCIEVFLRLISPVMPFISEELYQRLKHVANIESKCSSICEADYPTHDQFCDWRNMELEAEIFTVIKLVEAIRSLKVKNNATKLQTPVLISTTSEEVIKATKTHRHIIEILGRTGVVDLQSEAFKQSDVTQTLEDGTSVSLDISNLELKDQSKKSVSES